MLRSHSATVPLFGILRRNPSEMHSVIGNHGHRLSGVPLYRMPYSRISSRHLPGFCRGVHFESTIEDAPQSRERDSHNKNIPQSNILKNRDGAIIVSEWVPRPHRYCSRILHRPDDISENTAFAHQDSIWGQSPGPLSAPRAERGFRRRP